MLEVYPGDGIGRREVVVTRPDGTQERFDVRWDDAGVVATGTIGEGWSVRIAGPDGATTTAMAGEARITW